MKIGDALRHRRAEPGEPSEAAAPHDDGQCPISGYDGLDARRIGERLAGLSQVELAEVEAYERAHRERRQVLDKLRYMRTDEPLPGYDSLTPEQIAEALAGADSGTVKAVRDYERKFRHRAEVMEDAMRLLATAQPSPADARAREAQEARVREGFAKRAKTVRDMPDAGAEATPDGR